MEKKIEFIKKISKQVDFVKLVNKLIEMIRPDNLSSEVYYSSVDNISVGSIKQRAEEFKKGSYSHVCAYNNSNELYIVFLDDKKEIIDSFPAFLINYKCMDDGLKNLFNDKSTLIFS